MTVLEARTLLTLNGAGAIASLSDGFTLHVDLLENWLCRVAVVPEAGFTVANSWMVAPEGDVPWQGRPRLDTAGFSCPPVVIDDDGKGVACETLSALMCNRNSCWETRCLWPL